MRGWAVWVVVAVFGCDGEQPASSSAPAASAPASASGVASGVASAAPIDETAAKEELKKLLADYKKAIYAKDGTRSVELVSKRTLDYYDSMRDAALRAPAARVRSMRVMDKLMVLLLRARMKPSQLEKMSGRDLFVYAVEQGWIGEEARTLEADEVEIEGDEGLIGIKSADGQKVPPKLGFRAYREEGKFKLDVLSIAPIAEVGLDKMLKQIDPNVDAALIKTLEILVGDRLPPTIWDPPRAPRQENVKL